MHDQRRQFLQFLGSSTAYLAGCSTLPFITQCGGLSSQTNKPHRLKPLGAQRKDDVVLAPGFTSQVLVRWEDPINDKGDRFGASNDYTALIHPANLTGDEGLLWVNHETCHPMFIHRQEMSAPRNRKHIHKEQDSVGGSFIRVKKQASGHWQMIKDNRWNRRITARTPMAIHSERPIAGTRQALGTLANCAGGVTPWGTILTCEENYDSFYGDIVYGADGLGKRTPPRRPYGWSKYYDVSPEHYGWVVEVEPISGKATKLTPLGRFAHECATTTKATDGRCVVYMGDDKADECVYKFISDSGSSLLKGELFVADLKNKRWQSLALEKQPKLQKVFSDQQSILIRTREAAKIVGGSPLNRPEDVAIQPGTGNVFVAQTNSVSKADFYGSLLKIVEQDGDAGALEFEWSTFMAGGAETGFACPDNLAFDKKGQLWFTTDISEKYIETGPYKGFGNNSLFYVPLSGPSAGQALRVASAPIDAEFTGPTFSADGETLFLSVQHPGGGSEKPGQWTSHWPDGGDKIPRSSVITISGPTLKSLMA